MGVGYICPYGSGPYTPVICIWRCSRTGRQLIPETCFPIMLSDQACLGLNPTFTFMELRSIDMEGDILNVLFYLFTYESQR